MFIRYNLEYCNYVSNRAFICGAFLIFSNFDCLFLYLPWKIWKPWLQFFSCQQIILCYYYFLRCRPFCLCCKTWTSKRGRIYFAINSRSSRCGLCRGEEKSSPQDGSQDQGRREGGKEGEWNRDADLFHLSTWVTVCSLIFPTCTLFRPEVSSLTQPGAVHFPNLLISSPYNKRTLIVWWLTDWNLLWS